MIDFRSDTVTKPSEAMREFMFQASVGDDVYGEDPTVNELQEFAARMFGKEAALFASSGTQTNQIAINVHVSPGGEVICHEDSHIYKYEGGGIARNSGASVRLLKGNRGRMEASEVAKWINDPKDVHLPLTQLVSVEDTANRGGGAIYDFAEIQKISSFCRQQHLPLHVDGARLMNALVETQINPADYGQQFDSMSICLSKGLGAPVGSLLLGSADFIEKARRVRKVMGGGMRQAGILAAGGLFALKNNVERLKTDHLHAKQLEQVLNELDWINQVYPVETNIVIAELTAGLDQQKVVELLREQGVLISAFGPGMIRLVTHLDISSEQIDQAGEQLKKLKIGTR